MNANEPQSRAWHFPRQPVDTNFTNWHEVGTKALEFVFIGEIRVKTCASFRASAASPDRPLACIRVHWRFELRIGEGHCATGKASFNREWTLMNANEPQSKAWHFPRQPVDTNFTNWHEVGTKALEFVFIGEIRVKTCASFRASAASPDRPLACIRVHWRLELRELAPSSPVVPR